MPDFDFKGYHPARTASHIHTAVDKVVPIHGISIGKWDDRSTWRIDFQAGATDEQKAAAQQVMMDFNYPADEHPEDVGAPRVIP